MPVTWHSRSMLNWCESLFYLPSLCLFVTLAILGLYQQWFWSLCCIFIFHGLNHIILHLHLLSNWVMMYYQLRERSIISWRGGRSYRGGHEFLYHRWGRVMTCFSIVEGGLKVFWWTFWGLIFFTCFLCILYIKNYVYERRRWGIMIFLSTLGGRGCDICERCRGWVSFFVSVPRHETPSPTSDNYWPLSKLIIHHPPVRQ